ncbi:hypothetical protein LEP1GSC203_1375 [Leptospira terpstrae serovar Hualin str. LT 11-33 = ATCC 700639]|uniref:Uncharacterized protein n=1 Tax=Leptospira terpstrae serovar Hualin str. LT 11-33 = ATCC 700639 TaxID=1257025 RepID=N1W2E6_9LEPT|nr:hypothetical protein LEP1GSC203_1375 [Leptospira terpstrae serovar Hualin str. LT 11-33 = ATCC 700639]
MVNFVFYKIQAKFKNLPMSFSSQGQLIDSNNLTLDFATVVLP